MFKPDWICFQWKLKELPTEAPTTQVQADFRLATDEDKHEVWSVIERSYQAESGWGAVYKERAKELKELCYKGLEDKLIEFVIAEHGKRIIGVSGISTEKENPRQLVSGICVYDEYRCRGLGSILLYKSLKLLKDKGVETACVVTKSNVAACKFLYPKFRAESTKVEKLPELAQFV